MKKLIFLPFLVLLLANCSKDNPVKTNSLQVEMLVEYENNKLRIREEIAVYLFEKVNLLNGYTLGQEGKLINETTGAEISYSQKKISSTGTVFFDNLENTTHTIVVDASKTFVEEFSGNKINGSSINLSAPLHKDGGELTFSFDIWPYSPSTIYR